MGVKKSDWAIRAEKERMLRDVADIQYRYARIDQAEWTLAKNKKIIDETLKKYREDLRKPMVRFFAGGPMEEMAVEAHEQFIRSLKTHLDEARLSVSKVIPEQLLNSLRFELSRNVDFLLNDMELNLTQRAIEYKTAAAESATGALAASINTTQLKIENITARTTGKKDLAKAWEDLQDQYGTRATVKYRDGKNYPLNTYLDGRANTTSADIHRLTTQLDASEAGVYTGKISSHGATDSCRVWEGKIVFFTSAGRDIMSRKYPQAAAIKTVDEIKNDKNTHLWKFNCRHTVSAYPIQFFAEADIAQELAA